MKCKVVTLVVGLCLSNVTLADGWKGQGEAGLIKASGNTESENINVGLKFSKEGQVWDNEFAIVALKASNNSVDSANRLSADYKLKRQLTVFSNIFLNLTYLDDDFDGFTEKLGAAFGYGLKVIDSKAVAWEIGAGVGYRDTSEFLKLMDGRRVEGNNLSSATFALRSDYQNQLTENTQFIDKFKADIGSDNNFIENEAALVVSMNEKFSLKAGLIIRHNTDPAEDFDDTDTISSVSLVYKFAQ